jgi:hypothetical protein
MATIITPLSIPNNILTGSSSQLVVTRDMVRNFGLPEDYVEMHLADPAGKHIFSIIPFQNYQIPGTFQPTIDGEASIQELVFDPELDLKNLGIKYGDYNITYNIFRPKIIKDYNQSLFLKEISSDRTEIRLDSHNISNVDLIANSIDFVEEFSNSPYFKEFYLNFGKNILYPAINVAFDLASNTILIKLLNQLPLKHKVNDLLSVVDEISNSQVFGANLYLDPVKATFPTLRGPNFDLDLDNLKVGPTPYYNFSQITSFQGDFAPQLQQLLGQLSASNFSINVDYIDYENFIHFSSAARRLEGFKYKLTNIESFTEASSSASINPNPSSQLDAQSYQSKINKVIQSFDGYEQYLYYESSSYSWPKQNPDKPYINYSITSSEASIWYSGNYDSSSRYDENNQDYILYTLPGYITENTDNELAFEFVSSVGQMFDDIWIHIKAIADLYQAKNSLTEGISKDLVYFALQSMGVNVYTDKDGQNVFQYLYGVSEDGSYLPLTGSYETLVSASNYQLPGQDIQKGIYKRLYHNLPLLLKSKGTTRFNQYLNTIFGIPSTIMGAIEYGGVDKITSSFEYEYDRFTYGLNLDNTSYVEVPWDYLIQSDNRTGYNDIVADGIEFRFKAYTTASSEIIANFPTQSLLYNSSTNLQFDLTYTDTASADSIYAGTIGDFGWFKFTLGGTEVTSSTIPVFTTGSDGETSWYSVLIQRRYPNTRIGDVGNPQYYDIYVKNNIWGETGHITTASLYTTSDNSDWSTDGTSIVFGDGFTGSMQEIRLWSNYISESVFDSHVLNPESIEGNFPTSSFQDLAARFTLGNNLYTYNHSITSTVDSTHPDQSTQILTATFSNFPNENNYSSFTETYYADVANSGYANPVTDKIRIYSGSNYGTQLLPHKSIDITPNIPLTKDIHLLDASLSPQDEIDRAIIAALGSTYSIDDIIGDPTYDNYSQLNVLQQDFFKKFIGKYNYKDYIRLIDFFHNSLFRTLKDFTPARTNLSTGIVIKPHLLERSVNTRPEQNVTDFNNLKLNIITAFITGSNSGNYSQSLYDITYVTPQGPVIKLSDARDFFTGEIPSSSVNIHDIIKKGTYNPYLVYNPLNNFYNSFSSSIWNYSYNPLLNNVSNSPISKIRQKITYITSGSKLVEVLEPVELQDFTYKYSRHIRPRYLGSKTTSTDYNYFSSNTQINFGTYGKNPTIDNNSINFIYFNQAVATGSQLLAAKERTNLYCKYLVDKKGNLNELVSRKYEDVKNNEFWNLYQMQNIFKQGDTINISLFDNQKPSPQKSLDGNKIIFNSGYKYYPVLWRQYSELALQYYVPQGLGTSPWLDPTKYGINNWHSSNSENIHYGWVEYSYDFNINIQANNLNPTLAPFDITVLAKVKKSAKDPYCCSRGLGRDENVEFNFTRGNPQNYVSTTFYTSQGGFYFDSFYGIDVIAVYPTNGEDPNSIYEDTDSIASLTVHSSDHSWISASAKLSDLKPNEDLNSIFYSGSTDLTSTNTSDYAIYNAIIAPYKAELPSEFPIKFNKMDLLRIDSGSKTKPPTTTFKPKNEFNIIEIGTGSHLTFKVDRPVEDYLTGSNGSIDRYIFSSRVTDETNIVIRHQKNPGISSGGIGKNNDLLLSIDNDLGNIVSDLKNKIFSTVLQ